MQMLIDLDQFSNPIRAVEHMNESSNLAYIIAVVFIVVFVLNVLPAFAPPTWTTMSFIGLAIPNIDVLLLAAVAAIAATCGRIVLAKLSRALVRQRLLTENSRRNIDAKLELRISEQ